MEILCDRINECLNLNVTIESLDTELREIADDEEEYQEILNQSLEITECNYKNLDSVFIEDFESPQNENEYFSCVDEISILNNFIPKRLNCRILNIDTNLFIDFENKIKTNTNFIFELCKNYNADIVCFQNYLYPIKFDCINFLNNFYSSNNDCCVNDITIEDPIEMINSLFPYLICMPNLNNFVDINPFTSCGLLTSSKYKPYFEEYFKLDVNTGFSFFIINFGGDSLCIMNIYLEKYTHEFIKKLDNISFLVDTIIIMGKILDNKYFQDLKNSYFVNALKNCSFSGINNESVIFFKNVEYDYKLNFYYTKKLSNFPIILDF